MSEGGISILRPPSPPPVPSASSLNASPSPPPAPSALGYHRLQTGPCMHGFQTHDRKRSDLRLSTNSNHEHISRADGILDHSCIRPAAMAAPSNGSRSGDSEAQKTSMNKRSSGGVGGRTNAHGSQAAAAAAAPTDDPGCSNYMCPRKRLARHRLQVAGKVEIPDAWCGNERLLEWAASGDAVEAALRPPDLVQARTALVSAASRIGTGAGAHEMPMET